MALYRPWTPLIVPPKLDGKTLEPLLNALVEIDKDFLRENPRVPLLYETKPIIHYQAEPPGEEKWLTVPWVLACNAGDCEDLACWRAAELQLRGENAQPTWSSKMTPSGELYHIQVMRGDGTIEDPSWLLGMGWEKQFALRNGPVSGLTDPNMPWVAKR